MKCVSDHQTVWGFEDDSGMILFLILTVLHSERPKLHRVLAILSAIGLNKGCDPTFEPLGEMVQMRGHNIHFF